LASLHWYLDYANDIINVPMAIEAAIGIPLCEIVKIRNM
jgi:hypothetical protein